MKEIGIKVVGSLTVLFMIIFNAKFAFADSEYPHSDVQADYTIWFIIGFFVIVIIVIALYILSRIRYKNDMKMLNDQISEEEQETSKDE